MTEEKIFSSRKKFFRPSLARSSKLEGSPEVFPSKFSSQSHARRYTVRRTRRFTREDFWRAFELRVSSQGPTKKKFPRGFFFSSPCPEYPDPDGPATLRTRIWGFLLFKKTENPAKKPRILKARLRLIFWKSGLEKCCSTSGATPGILRY